MRIFWIRKSYLALTELWELLVCFELRKRYVRLYLWHWNWMSILKIVILLMVTSYYHNIFFHIFLSDCIAGLSHPLQVSKSISSQIIKDKKHNQNHDAMKNLTYTLTILHMNYFRIHKSTLYEDAINLCAFPFDKQIWLVLIVKLVFKKTFLNLRKFRTILIANCMKSESSV